MLIKNKKTEVSPKADGLMKININKLITIVIRFLVSKKSILYTLFFIIFIILLKTFLEVQATSYLGEIGEAIGDTGLFLKQNYKKYLLCTITYLTLYATTLWISIPLIRKAYTELGIEQVEKIFNLSYQDFRKGQLSYYISNLNRSSTAVSEFLEALFIRWFNTIAVVLFSGFKLYIIFGVKISLVFLGVMIIYFLFTYYFTIIRMKYHIQSIKADNVLQNQLLEKLENRDTIIMLEMWETEKNNLRQDFENYQKNTILFARSLPILNVCQDLIFFSFFFVLLFYMIFNSNNKLEKKNFITAFSLLINLRFHISSLGWTFQLLYKTAANVTSGYLLMKCKKPGGAKCNQIKEIEFLGFSKGRSSGLKMFNKISLRIDEPGSYVIVGPNGAGKSTLVKALMGFYNNRKGIFINKEPLELLNIEEFQRRIVYASQECQLFAGTILYNLQYGNNKTFAEIISLCKELGLEEFILSQPEGYMYEIGRNGNKLSGGEKQKLVFARSILRNADVYIFDEPTANVDEISEFILLTKTNHILKNKTIFYIIHNLKLVHLFDKVIFVNTKGVSNPRTFAELVEMNEEFSEFIKSRVYK
ncbi:ATP-binding cassette sub-family B member 7, mitochondrial [Cucumispora dikerogammari]|nr:ATP-binding cassette sub-family B member 7, mitochondrial [Cucumispora dikerogammari]